MLARTLLVALLAAAAAAQEGEAPQGACSAPDECGGDGPALCAAARDPPTRSFVPLGERAQLDRWKKREKEKRKRKSNE